MSEPISRLLVVDDNELNRDMLTRRLIRQGYEVETAEDGQQALDILNAKPSRFDVVLLDIMMPRLNGFDVLARLKEDPKLRDIPVIVVSANDEMESIVKCIELGAQDYLTKPVNAVLLNARLGPTLERKRAHDQERAYMKRIEAEKRRADELLNVVIPAGIGLSAERDFDQLLEMVVIQAMRLAHADGGSLYLREGDALVFAIVRNHSLGIAMGGTSGNKIDFPPLVLNDADGTPNQANIATYSALHNKVISIADAYTAEAFDFSGTRAFDQRTGYRTTSVLAIPLTSASGEVTGVLQLINARDPETDSVIAFDRHVRELSESLALLASSALEASLREIQLRHEIEALRIVVDEQRRARQVEEITETQYFRDLREKARDFRRRASGRSAD